jgi:hypothetical protein
VNGVDGAQCDGGPIEFDSKCCKQYKNVMCPFEKCSNHQGIYMFIAAMHFSPTKPATSEIPIHF